MISSLNGSLVLFDTLLQFIKEGFGLVLGSVAFTILLVRFSMLFSVYDHVLNLIAAGKTARCYPLELL
jgi:hypothetical protein